MTAPAKYLVRFAASDDDLEACYALRTEAENWLATAGIEQWTNPQVGRDAIRSAFDDGSLYVFRDDVGKVVACCALNGPDQDFWRPWEMTQAAVYVYKLIISRAHGGNGFGDVILDWACHVAHQAGAKWLRLDCWKDNTVLQKYYLDRGFEHLDTRTAPGRNSGWLAQRDVHRRTADDRIVLIDETAPVHRGNGVFHPGDQHRYDPYGVAAVLQSAAGLVLTLRTEQPPISPGAWNAALEQASRLIELRVREEKQSSGMYYRALLGTTGTEPKTDDQPLPEWEEQAS